MAIWQFDVFFVPRGSVAPDTSTSEWEPFLTAKVARAIQEDFAHYLGVPWLMLNNWLVYGPENGNRIDVSLCDDGSASINVRIDIRNDAPQFLVLVTELAQLHHCTLFCPELGEVIEPDVHQILSAITRWQSSDMGLP